MPQTALLKPENNDVVKLAVSHVRKLLRCQRVNLVKNKIVKVNTKKNKINHWTDNIDLRRLLLEISF